jgi:hypothetical protein
VIPVSDKIQNLHDWLLLPPEMRRGSAGAAVVLDEIAASHADLLAACEDLTREYESLWSEMADGQFGKPNSPAYKRALSALAKARGA